MSTCRHVLVFSLSCHFKRTLEEAAQSDVRTSPITPRGPKVILARRLHSSTHTHTHLSLSPTLNSTPPYTYSLRTPRSYTKQPEKKHTNSQTQPTLTEADHRSKNLNGIQTFMRTLAEDVPKGIYKFIDLHALSLWTQCGPMLYPKVCKHQ